MCCRNLKLVPSGHPIKIGGATHLTSPESRLHGGCCAGFGGDCPGCFSGLPFGEFGAGGEQFGG